ncbi:CMRF35-like molecule 7 [Pteronotus mesoamericanus]|uniref:CMRF35-like molecule 7 n=1 Tax=Pteronotus mesoamericanus TaxID=1884717 RepID=UPI0023ECB45D|nr:CMRF35-like molecule 7 [Pteronotus parnellii mesoamericanus]
MWLLLLSLFLLSLPGCFPIQGPQLVRGPEQGSLTVQCRYDPGWEHNGKWWCRGANWRFCQILVETTGSEQEVKKGRVSIRDNQRDRLITVTTQDLRRDDEDAYWCGIKKPGPDLGARVSLIIEPQGGHLSQSKSLLSGTAAKNNGGVSSGSIRNHYMLLVFVKVPILLLLVGAILWLKRPQRAPEEQSEEPIYTNLSSDLAANRAP